MIAGAGANAAEATIGYQIGGRPGSRQDRIVISLIQGDYGSDKIDYFDFTWLLYKFA